MSIEWSIFDEEKKVVKKEDEDRAFLEILEKMQQHISNFESAILSEHSILEPEVRRHIYNVVAKELVSQRLSLGSIKRDELAQRITDYIAGYGPLQPLINDDSVTDIMVNVYNEIYYSTVNNRMVRYDRTFPNESSMMRLIRNIIESSGRQINRGHPMEDAQMPDGNRINVVVDPIAIRGPCITIRKFPKFDFVPSDLVRNKTLTQEELDFLKEAVESKLNIFIGGGGGSGKTTLMKILCHFIGERERLITIEDTPELRLYAMHENVVALEARDENSGDESATSFSMKNLLRNSLRQNPTRILIGEVRGNEIFEALQAANVGHPGIITTIHAEGIEGIIPRIKDLVIQDDPSRREEHVYKDITERVDIIISMREDEKHRGIAAIAEVVGYENGNVILNLLFENHKMVGGYSAQKIISKINRYLPKNV